MKEDILIKLSLLEQQSQEIRQQLENVEAQTADMESLKSSIERLEDNKNSEILSNLGKGIFIKAKITEEELFVNVGSKILVKKNFKEAVEIIDKQIIQLKGLKSELMNNTEAINMNLQELIQESSESAED